MKKKEKNKRVMWIFTITIAIIVIFSLFPTSDSTEKKKKEGECNSCKDCWIFRAAHVELMTPLEMPPNINFTINAIVSNPSTYVDKNPRARVITRGIDVLSEVEKNASDIGPGGYTVFSWNLRGRELGTWRIGVVVEVNVDGEVFAYSNYTYITIKELNLTFSQYIFVMKIGEEKKWKIDVENRGKNKIRNITFDYPREIVDMTVSVGSLEPGEKMVAELRVNAIEKRNIIIYIKWEEEIGEKTEKINTSIFISVIEEYEITGAQNKDIWEMATQIAYISFFILLLSFFNFPLNRKWGKMLRGVYGNYGTGILSFYLLIIVLIISSAHGLLLYSIEYPSKSKFALIEALIGIFLFITIILSATSIHLKKKKAAITLMTASLIFSFIHLSLGTHITKFINGDAEHGIPLLSSVLLVMLYITGVIIAYAMRKKS